ncbi:MAG: SIMPL domain-containing protein [Kiritimatiellae bacterium]|nr:SIMPL domain-containing protein [Kiritimatiellia bacterium]
MKKLAVWLSVAAMAASGLAGELAVTGKGTVRRAPDKMKIVFSVSATEPDLASARKAFAGESAKVAQALAAAGVEISEVTTAGGYMNKSYRYEDGKRIFEGYRMTEEYTVTAPMDRERLDRIKTTLFKSEAIGSLEERFELYDPEALRGEARAAAVANARTIAGELAKAAGVKLGEITLIEYGEAGGAAIGYRNMVMAKGMECDEAEFGASGIEAQARELSVGDSVSIRWKLEN